MMNTGSAVNNLPVTAARRLGADYVIGVDLFLSPLRAQRNPPNTVLWAVKNYAGQAGACRGRTV